jgi:HAD superfamily hydrolase (TIGR01509 family)
VIRAVIFDLDGLLVDSEVYWERARRAYCAGVGCEWRNQDELAAKGKNSREWAALIQERCRDTPSLEEIISGVTRQMEALYRERLPLLPGAVESVELLHARYPLGLASSSPPQLIRFVLDESGILEYFSAIVSSDDVGRGKPDPAVFLEAGRRLGALPDGIAVFEDSSSGIQAAKAAGMHVIAVPNAHFPPTREALRRADMTLDSLTELSPASLDRLCI